VVLTSSFQASRGSFSGYPILSKFTREKDVKHTSARIQDRKREGEERENVQPTGVAGFDTVQR